MIRRRPELAAALAVFLLLLVRPAAICSLRRQFSARLPAAWARLPSNGSFTLLVPFAFTTRYHDEAQFAARVRQVLVHGAPVNPYWAEDKSWATVLHDGLSAYLMAAIAFLCGGDLTAAWSLAVALFGALWFLLFHAVFKAWCGEDKAAVPLALFSALFPDLYVWLLDVNFSLAAQWHRYFNVFFQDLGEIRPHFHRLPSLFISMLALASALLLAWRFSSESRFRPGRAILLGQVFGLLVFLHPYEAVFGAGTLWLFALALWSQGRGRARWNLLLAAVSGLVLPLAYAGVLRAVDPQVQRDSLEMDGLTHTHRFYWITLVHWLAAGFGLWRMALETRRPRRMAWLILVCAQGAAFLCRNSQVVTGSSVQPFHFIPPGSFMGTLMLFLWCSERLAASPGWTRSAGAVASAGVLVWGLANELSAAGATYQLFGLPADSESALAWVRDNAPPGTPVLSLSMETNEEVVLYTSARALVPPAAPPASGLFSKEQYLGKVAQLLKTCHADVERFLAERWLTPAMKEPVFARLAYEERHLQRVDLGLFEQAEWFYPYIHGNLSDAPVLEGRRRLLALAREAPRPEGRFYIWVNDRDVPLLKELPGAFGGKLVYQNGSVRIYEFAG